MNKKEIQPMTRSQFVLTYGPGSILESKNGPRIIPSIQIGLTREIIEQYELHDVRMANLLKKDSENKNVGLFVLPSYEAEKNKRHKRFYRTFPFPKWKICHGNHKSDNSILFYDPSNEEVCPICKKKSNSYVRFVRACPSGHLDDVNWNYIVHGHESKKCKTGFEWIASGSSISDISIKCLDCGSEINFGEIYAKTSYCSGRVPEKEFSDEEFHVKCNQRMRIIPRQSNSLRLASTKTLLTIPKFDKNIHRLLNRSDIKPVIKAAFNLHNTGVLDDKIFLSLFSDEEVKKIFMDELAEYEDLDDFLNFIELFYNSELTFDEVLKEEFEALSDFDYNKTDNFSKGNSEIIKFKINDVELPFIVAPIHKLRTITVQKSYQRNPHPKKDKDGDNTNPDNVDIGYEDFFSGKIWYPAFEGIGEGIFISSLNNPLNNLNLENHAKTWYDQPESYNNSNNPLYIWWHTLSHALIKSLSYVSGYSMASIRERVYVEENGGVLLYNTSPGDDCGLGGLTGVLDNFEEVLRVALDFITNCSYDPLCSDVRINKNRLNGAACINCLFISETSCENSNLGLDRHMLLGD